MNMTNSTYTKGTQNNLYLLLSILGFVGFIMFGHLVYIIHLHAETHNVRQEIYDIGLKLVSFMEKTLPDMVPPQFAFQALNRTWQYITSGNSEL